MRHEDFQERLHDLVDGQLPDPERLEMESHAAGCRECARDLESLGALLEAARRLPRSIEPSRDLWPQIESAIGAAAPAEPRAPRVPGVKRRWLSWPAPSVPRWATAGALAVLAVIVLSVARELDRQRALVSVAAASGTNGLFPATLSGLELECMGAGKLLQASLRLPVGPRTQEMADSLADGLVAAISILDRSIGETQQALAADPGNLDLQRMLAARYQQKLALLHTALLRVETT